MITVIKTNSDNPHFQALVRELDKELKVRDGEEHGFYSQYNKIGSLKNVVVVYENENPVGCGAIKTFSDDAMEVKRMFVPVDKRGQGIASVVLKELETWAKEIGYKKCVLETGQKQPEAIGLYKKSGYTIIPNYGQYIGIGNSVCFEKSL